MKVSTTELVLTKKIKPAESRVDSKLIGCSGHKASNIKNQEILKPEQL